jgi:hypothetical protein
VPGRRQAAARHVSQVDERTCARPGRMGLAC